MPAPRRWGSMSSLAPIREEAGARTARRDRLIAADNPARHLDYVVTLAGRLGAQGGDSAEVALAYVPDRAVIAPDSFATYLELLAAQGLGTAEEIGAAVLADIDSEIVPRYLRVTVAAEARPGVPRHEARFETRQPGWANDGAVTRLG